MGNLKECVNMLEQLRKHFENMEEGKYVYNDENGKRISVLYENDNKLLATTNGVFDAVFEDKEKAFAWLLK